MSINIGGSFGLLQAKSLDTHITSNFEISAGFFSVILMVAILIWIPVVDKATWNKQKFEYLQSTMPWHSFCDPFIIKPSVIKYIKEMWNYKQRAILVALYPQGRLSSQNALHMICIWGNLAFPFTSEKEESLWKQEIWSLELLVDDIDPTVLDWMTEGKFICLYGGEDLESIRHVTTFLQWDPEGWSLVQNENSGSSSSEVEETDAGGFYQ